MLPGYPATIAETALKVFEANTSGSLLYDAAKGDDIDLLVLSRRIPLRDKLETLALLHPKVGERKINMAVCSVAIRPFPGMIMQTGVLL